MSLKRLVLIEDDEAIRRELTLFLTRHGFEVIAIVDFEHVLTEVLALNSDLILLDLNLPYYDGHYLCKEIRKISQVPIIVVTSQNSQLDELMSMNLGADDFVTKPYHTQILLARITSVLRRAQQEPEQGAISTHKGVSLDLTRGVATCGDKTCELTKNEMRILGLLIDKKGQIVTRSDIMEALWQSDAFVDDNTLTVNINRLRKKLESIDALDYLVTKRGLGYMV